MFTRETEEAGQPLTFGDHSLESDDVGAVKLSHDGRFA